MVYNTVFLTLFVEPLVRIDSEVQTWMQVHHSECGEKQDINEFGCPTLEEELRSHLICMVSKQ